MFLATTQLDREIIIQNCTGSTDSYGQKADIWSTYATCWANVLATPSSESLEGGPAVSETSAVFLTRYRSNITAAMRIVHDSKTWRIQSVAEIGRREGLRIQATEAL